MKDIPLDEVSTSYTINASAFVLIGMYEVVCKAQRRAERKDHRHLSERHPQGVHGAERVHLSAGAGGAPGRGYDGVRG
jgi:methylmalonyl-CoA mutase N-terminal domain/subunit